MDTAGVAQQIAVAENAHDWAGLGDLLADDVTIHHPGLGAITGRAENLAVFEFIAAAIAGYHRTTEGLVVDGERGAFTFVITGAHTGDLPGCPATGLPVEISGAMHFRIVDGRLQEASEILNHDSIRGISLR